MAKRRKRRRRESVSSAIIRFLIGMLLIALIVMAGYYLLFKADYSRHLINSDGTYASTRAYVLPTDGSSPEPEGSAAAPTAVPASAVPDSATAEPTAEPTATPEPLIIIATLEPTPTPEPTPSPEPEATPEPTAVPTPVPTATPEPTPEPDGARIPESSFSAYRTDLKVPKAYNGAEVGVSRCYVSRLNYYQVMQVNGWGYIDVPEFNGLTCTTYALVTPAGESRGRIYQCINRDGASRRIHEPEYAENVYAADFEVTIDTSDYESGDYELKLILQFAGEEKTYVYLCPFEKTHTFSVVDGEVISPIPLD